MTPLAHLAELIRSLGSVASSSIVLLGALGACIKPIRTLVKRWVRQAAGTEDVAKVSRQITTLQGEVKHLSDNFACLKEAQLCLLRNDITQHYLAHLADHSMASYERENILHMSEVYGTLGGNSYVDLITQEMLEEWDITIDV